MSFVLAPHLQLSPCDDEESCDSLAECDYSGLHKCSSDTTRFPSSSAIHDSSFSSDLGLIEVCLGPCFCFEYMHWNAAA